MATGPPGCRPTVKTTGSNRQRKGAQANGKLRNDPPLHRGWTHIIARQSRRVNRPYSARNRAGNQELCGEALRFEGIVLWIGVEQECPNSARGHPGKREGKPWQAGGRGGREVACHGFKNYHNYRWRPVLSPRPPVTSGEVVVAVYHRSGRPASGRLARDYVFRLVRMLSHLRGEKLGQLAATIRVWSERGIG